MTDRDAPHVDDQAVSGPAARTTATGYRSVSYYLPAALHARLKAAWWATRDCPDGAPTLSALVEGIFLEYVTRVELERNDGQPFPPAPRNAQGPRGAASEDHRLVAYYLPANLHARLKATWWALRDARTPALSSVVEALFVDTAATLEQRHNDGVPFPPAPDSARGVSRAAAVRQGEWMRREWEIRRGESSTQG